MTREFKSWRSFWDFNHAVRRKLRYVRAPEHEEFLKTVAETSHSCKVVMKEGFVLWRAQLGHEYREEKQGDEVFEIEAAYSPARMKPLPDKAYDGRANPKGIPCLYPQPARKRHFAYAHAREGKASKSASFARVAISFPPSAIRRLRTVPLWSKAGR